MMDSQDDPYEDTSILNMTSEQSSVIYMQSSQEQSSYVEQPNNSAS